MGFKIKKEKDIEEGDYLARLSEAQAHTGAFGPCIKFQFEVVEGDFAGQEVSMIRPARLAAGNKLDRTLQEMGLDTSQITDEVDVDVLKGKVFKVHIENKTSSKGKVFANVITARPVSGYSTPVTSAATPAPTVTRTATPQAAPRTTPSQVQPNIEDVPF